jgi:hypothetical protein
MKYKFVMPGLRFALTIAFWVWTVGGAALGFLTAGSPSLGAIAYYTAGVVALSALCLSVPVNYTREG